MSRVILGSVNALQEKHVQRWHVKEGCSEKIDEGLPRKSALRRQLDQTLVPQSVAKAGADGAR